MKTQLIEILGFFALIAGVGMIFIPAALIVGGILLIVAAYALDLDDKTEGEPK